MFKEYTVPERKYTSCTMCLHYNNKLLKSGLNPIREHYCTHPKFDGYEDFMSSSFGKRDGRKIGKNSNTPKWCPFLPQKDGRRTFSQITPDECLQVAKIAKPGCFVNPETVWKVKKADRDVYTLGGYVVKSADNYFEFAFDFEKEDVKIWDSGYREADHEYIDIQSHYQIVQFLNSKKIYFSWQSVISI